MHTIIIKQSIYMILELKLHKDYKDLEIEDKIACFLLLSLTYYLTSIEKNWN